MCAVAVAPTILVFDSGLGGLTVFREVFKARPDARYVYAADDAFFGSVVLRVGQQQPQLVRTALRAVDRCSPVTSLPSQPWIFSGGT